MLFRSSLATMTLAGLAIAELVPKPYKMKLAKMSVRDVFGLERRDDGGYQPTQTFCGTGTTCSEACGAGFEQCVSKDTSVHCYNPAAKQICCGTGTGDSCDDGYFCSSDKEGATWCCPNGMSLEECAKEYSVTGGLSSALPVQNSAAASPTASSAAPITMSDSVGSSSSAPAEASPSADITDCTTYTSDIVHTVAPTPFGSAVTTAGNATAATPTYVSPTAPAATTPVTAGSSQNFPAGMLALLGFFALAF